jgi:hypothetical protein
VLRSASYITRRVVIAAVAALLATACAGTAPPATVVERELPPPDRAKKLSKAPQPAKPVLQPASSRNGVTEPVLLHWEIRKEGK